MSADSIAQIISGKLFPEWVLKPLGVPLVLESDWNYQNFPNSKWGMFADGTGTLSKDDKNLYNGGLGSCLLLTDATSNHTTEIKTSSMATCKKGELLAMEFKWVPTLVSSGTGIHCGIESRDSTNIVHSRFRYNTSTGEWRYEDVNLVYQPFPASIGGALTPERPTIGLLTGTTWGWARVIVDPVNRLYVGFQANGKGTFQVETRDMRSLNLSMVIEGSSAVNNYLYFILIQAGSNAVEQLNVTDLCISKIPPGVDPFG